MAVLIKDPETDRLIRDLAGRTGETITTAVKQAVRERLERVPRSEQELAVRRRRIAKILAELDAMPVVDSRTPDEIIGYNERGHFD
jgi:antitoxin VapB